MIPAALLHILDAVGTMARVTSQAGSSGKRAGARKGAKQQTKISRTALLLALAITVCVVAWGYLVWLAVDFGAAARGGETGAWALLAIACIGAAASLFVGLLLVVRLLRSLGILAAPDTPPSTPGRRVKS